jgi:hypothetical protein
VTDAVMGFLALLALLQGEQHGGGQAGPPGPPGPPAPVPDPGQPPPHVIPPPGDVTPPHGAPAPHVIPPPGDVTPTRPRPAPAPPIAPGPSPIPPMPPWPSPVPSGLPPFPGPGWVPDVPVTAAIAQRAAYWNPLLWNYPTQSIRRPYVQEQLGGQWVTFAAAWHPGNKGAHTFLATEAWRLATAPPVAPPAPAPGPSPVPPPAPGPAPGPQPAPVPVPALTPLQQAANDMNVALAGHGYHVTDQPLYRSFQSLAFPGSVPDGFPGTHTMTALGSVLASAGLTMAPVHVYPWRSAPGTSGYDGVNAPTLAEWQG